MTMAAPGFGEAAVTRMRAALRPHHDRIEASLDLMNPALDIAQYTHYLERAYGFVGECERRINRDAAPAMLALDSRMRSGLIRADLRQLGLSDARIDALGVPGRVPPVGTWPKALGYMYVIEGSTLGGQIVSRHVRATTGLPPEATTFLSGGPANVGAMWKAMLAVLSAEMRDETAERQITNAAADTFDLLREWHAA